MKTVFNNFNYSAVCTIVGIKPHKVGGKRVWNKTTER